MFHMKHTGGYDMSVEAHLHTLSALLGHLGEAHKCLENAEKTRRMLLCTGVPVKLYQKTEQAFRQRAQTHLRLAHSLYMGGEE
jgi:hypothetical protein